MKRYRLHPWFGTMLLSGLLALGCGHSRRQCRCSVTESCSPMSGRLVLLPVTPAKPKEVIAAKVEVTPADNVEVTMTYPAPDGSSAGSVKGTIILTAAEAKAMGIRPGYTPGAMYVCAQPRDEVVQTTPAAVLEKPREPAPAFLPAELAK